MELKLKKVIEFLKNRKVRYHIPRGDNNVVVVNGRFLLVPINYVGSSNLEIIRIDFSNDKWISIISKICNLNISRDMIKIYHQVKNNWYYFNEYELNRSWDAINKNIQNYSFKIIKHFHKSLIDSKRKKSLSPRIFLKSRKNIFFLIKNRFIYSKKVTPESIFNALSISSVSPIVSIFSPLLTKKIINSYYPSCNEVIDPFSGFSGRMLGTLSLGKEYYGGDIRQDVINESKEILNFIKLNAHLECSDFKDFSIRKGDLLLTCPPYGETELWEGVNDYYDEDYYIDWILSNFKCQKYIFIVKNTKYKNKIVDTIKNGSWYKSKDNEKILLFD
jgi:hypothetical protein